MAGNYLIEYSNSIEMHDHFTMPCTPGVVKHVFFLIMGSDFLSVWYINNLEISNQLIQDNHCFHHHLWIFLNHSVILCHSKNRLRNFKNIIMKLLKTTCMIFLCGCCHFEMSGCWLLGAVQILVVDINITTLWNYEEPEFVRKMGKNKLNFFQYSRSNYRTCNVMMGKYFVSHSRTKISCGISLYDFQIIKCNF